MVGGSWFVERDADPSTVYCLPRVLAGFTVHGARCIFAKKESALRLQYEGRFGSGMKGVSVAV